MGSTEVIDQYWRTPDDVECTRTASDSSRKAGDRPERVDFGSAAEAIYPVLLLCRTTKIPRDVEAATGRRGPIELRAWFGLHNGTSEEKPFAQTLPPFEPLSLERVSSMWTSMTTTWADTTGELGGTALLDEPAGTMSFTYLSAYIPIAENDQGDLLVVDTRAGEQHGCVCGTSPAKIPIRA